MGSVTSDAIPRKLKDPKKIYADSNTVVPACVPRKLRTAMRKPSLNPTSVSLEVRKRSSSLVNDVESISKECLKKSKLSMQNGMSHHSSISKEEEEVAETLSSLAAMIAPNEVKHEIVGAKPLDLEDKVDDQMVAPKDSVILKEEPDTSLHPAVREVGTSTPMTDGLPKDSLQTSSPCGTSALSRPALSERRQLNCNLQVSVSPVNLHNNTPLLRTCDQQSSLMNSNFEHTTEASLGKGLMEIKQEMDLFPRCKPCNKIGSSEPSSATMFPFGPRTCKDIKSTVKVWKRSAGHIYISHLIQVLQKGIPPLNSRQLIPSQFVLGGVGETNRGILTDSHMCIPTPYRNGHEAANHASINQKIHQIKEEDPSLSPSCTSKKLPYDFLSLSTGTGSGGDHDVNITGNNLEVGKIPVCRHAVPQHNAPVSFSMIQNHLPSYSYRDHAAFISGPLSPMPQVHLQVPTYFGNRLRPPTANMGSTSKAPQQPKQQQQQQNWNAQLATQFNPGPLFSSNRREDMRSITHHTPPFLPTFQPSLETHGTKYLHTSLHAPPRLIARGVPLPTTRTMPQHNQFPSSREDNNNNNNNNGGRFRADGIHPVQVQCRQGL